MRLVTRRAAPWCTTPWRPSSLARRDGGGGRNYTAFLQLQRRLTRNG
ncbi:UDP-N-acetylmuramyl tripeptide synthase domain protein [Mycobacterium ulcerans str. Harvey]|uniref:UDP-N-acetylmuramyl tripeptide synthase domain protein n=1 Tax=Mycobacterium ulcerans str. Harvey TaxID=1299332 RepID=A0ABN0RAI4_MYCUL|nr:UDP-N-acetylmuramyl tripeptide synthase domain protein [Mycobacterium ulcerans str. Harvey]